jgi:PadR family transcriptional regulator AphA
LIKLETICLGILYGASQSGYEIHKTINTVLKNFKSASFGALYPALGKLEVKRFIISKRAKTNNPNQSLPMRKYAITDEGRTRFEKLIRASSAEEKTTSDFLTALYFGEHLDSNTISRLIDQRLATLQNNYRELLSGPISTMTNGQRFTVRYTMAINKAATDFLKGEGRAIQSIMIKK